MHIQNIQSLSLDELRNEWTTAWGKEPHARVGRVMLEKSLEYKLHENLTEQQRSILNKWVKEYRRNPKCFDVRSETMKPGTQLVRVYKGKKHRVIVSKDGFEYEGITYSSLSKIANDITGSKWNGWIFFGLK